jgi:hypothetical protein
MECDRRDFLTSSGLFMMLLWRGAEEALATEQVPGGAWSPAALVPAGAHVRFVGRRYLALYPDECDGKSLWRQLTADGRFATAVSFRRHFLRMRGSDFANDRVVSIDGWVLAQSEARLCALVTLS